MGIENSNISWSCIEEKTFLDFPYLQIVERLCKNNRLDTEKDPSRFYVLKSRDWCNIIPITSEGKIVLIRQFRAGTLSHSYEFPGGVVESSDSDLQTTAIREMIEETGYEPTPDSKCRLLGSSHPNPALQDNRVHSLIIRGVKKTRSQSLDPNEDIEVIELSLDEFITWVQSGKLSHALMLVSLFHLLMGSKNAKESLVQELK